MIGIDNTPVDITLQKLLQRNISLVVNKKQWKTGKLILFKQSGFFVELTIDTVKKRERFEIPIPYNIYNKNRKYIFDYSFSTLLRGDSELINLTEQISKQIERSSQKNKNRFYNAIMEIELK